MAQFCTCGSIVIADQCTNKNCPTKSESKTSKVKPIKSESDSSAKSKPAKTRRASKCITYNINDLEQKEDAK